MKATRINEFWGCSLDVYLIVSQEATPWEQQKTFASVYHPAKTELVLQRMQPGPQPGGGIWGTCPLLRISKHCIAILTFAKTFKE